MTGSNSTEVYSCSPSRRKNDLIFTLHSACGNTMELVTPAPCHGLNLLFDSVAPAYYICNAATRAVTRLPPFRPVVRETSTGFGFDARARNHKVVRLINGMPRDDETVWCEVYTHGAGDHGDRWRPPAGGIPFGLCRFVRTAVSDAAFERLPPVFVNGSLHWLVKPRVTVVSFSGADENFTSVGRRRSGQQNPTRAPLSGNRWGCPHATSLAR
jgi:hypothetical protein